MSNVKVTIVHDEFGQIVSISRPAEGIHADVSTGSGQSALVAEIEEDSISDLMATHRVDAASGRLIRY